MRNATQEEVDTGLPTKDETSETIVRNLYGLFPYIQDVLFKAEYLISPWGLGSSHLIVFGRLYRLILCG